MSLSELTIASSRTHAWHSPVSCSDFDTLLSIAMQVQVAHAIFLCDPATITDVHNHFGDQLPQRDYMAALPENTFYNTSIIDRFSSDTAWRYLGCLPEITVLTIWIQQNTTLPDEWGAAGSFPNLKMLVLASDNLARSLGCPLQLSAT